MRIVPRRTSPFRDRLDRRHTPRLTRGRFGYKAYRACLRWEFGFTCGFCLAHESDLAEHGVEGTGLTTIEHFVPVGADEALAEARANDYANCFYACRYCNGSRADAPVVDTLGRRLLNPCSNAWGEHFTISDDDRLLPRAGDPDAEYTSEVYELNDKRRLEMRRSRRESLDEWLALLEQGPNLLSTLLDRWEALGPGAGPSVLIQTIESLRRGILRAERDLQRYEVISKDANAKCRCGYLSHHSLPPGIAEQTLDIRIPE